MTKIALFEDKRIILGVCGSIAVYKAVDLASKLRQAGAQLDIIMTEAAQRFVSPLSFQAVSGGPVYSDMWRAEASGGLPSHIAHIALAEAADLLVIAPATANTLAKLAGGFADDLLSVTALAATCKLLIAPAMDGGMLEHPATQANLETLRQRGAHIIEPESGRLASGLIGSGRLPETPTLLGHIRRVMGLDGELSGHKLVVTAGGTREALDPVRYLSNRSSGKQGFAIAQAAIDAGAEVVLISAADLPPPAGASLARVDSAEAMRAAVLEHVGQSSALIMAAAVADYRPRDVAKQKIKKSDASHNRATAQHGKGGGLCVRYNSDINIKNNSTIKFYNNSAAFGGAVSIETSSYLLIDENSSVLFSNNNALLDGGALFATSGSIIFKGISFVKLSNNIAKYNGGALSIESSSEIAFIENCMAVFYNNEARDSGGAMHVYGSSSVMHNKSSEVIYSNNTAKYGGAVYSEYYSDVTSDEESKLTFGGNMASQGGAMYLTTKSALRITGNSATKFTANKALLVGGAIKVFYSSIMIKSTSNVTISNNGAEKGGAVHCGTGCKFILTDDPSVSFCNNEAKWFGGAINLVKYSEIKIEGKSKLIFNNNTAKYRGGAIH